MNPFNPLSIVQSTFESDDVQHELKELVEIIRAYDIYDFLRRLSALNLQKENQKSRSFIGCTAKRHFI